MLGFGNLGQFALGEGPTDGGFGWFAALSDPVSVRRGARTGTQAFLAAMPLPIVSFGWMEELSKPQTLQKRGLPASQQQVLAWQPSPSPFVATGWFNWLSDPVRLKLGLRSALQQVLAWPPQLRPTPTSFAALNALETPDAFLGGVTDWNAIASGEAGIVVITAPGSETGLAPANTASPIASASVSIVII